MSENVKKAVTWYKKVKFWQFTAYVLTPFAVVGEGAIIGLSLHPALHVVVVVAIGVTGFNKYYVKDENNDGVID